MVDTPTPRITLPLMLGDSLLADVEVPIRIDAGDLANIKVTIDSDLRDHIVIGLRQAARRLAGDEPVRIPDGTFPIKWVTGMGEKPEWPTTPGSAVLADKKNGLGPQVLILQKTPTGEVGWWAATGSIDAPPGAQGGWAWESTSTASTRHTLLQVLHVAPRRW